MKKITLFLVLALAFALVGCSKDAEVNSFITELDGITNDMVKKINEGDIDGAKSAFDAKKESLKSKFAGIKEARGIQVSKEVQTKLAERATANGKALGDAIAANAMKLATDKEKLEKLQALMKEFTGILQ